MTKLKYFIISMFMILIASIGTSEAQTTIYSQPFGDSLGGLPSGWTNTGTLNWITSITPPVSNYTGASGGGYVYSGSGSGSAYLVTNNISLGTYNNLTVIWGARKDINEGVILFEYSLNNGSTWNPVAIPDVAPDGNWYLVNNGTRFLLNAVSGPGTIKFRWKLNNPIGYRIDDFSLQGTIVIGPPVKLAVLYTLPSICNEFRVNQPFSMTIQSQDINGNPSNVTAPTTITLTKLFGTGTLGGITTGSINTGSNTITITGILYDIAESGVIIQASGSGLTAANTASLTFGTNASQIVFYNFPANGTTNNVIPTFSVLGSYGGNQYDSCFAGTVIISQVSPAGNNMHGTLTRTSTGGGATFNDIYFDAPGLYQIQAVCNGFTTITSTFVNIVNGTPTLTEILLPKYMQGVNGVNNNRMPYAFLVELSNLLPNHQYKYFNQVILPGEVGINGAGNVIFVDYLGNAFSRTITPDFITAGNYGMFMTNGIGKFRGWFITEPTDDNRFTTGNQVKMNIIVNDGINTSRFPTSNTVTTINYGNPFPLGGAPIFSPNADPSLTPKNFIMMYGDSSIVGIGSRPVTGTLIEADGLNLNVEYFSPYRTFIDEVNNTYGAIIPSINGGIVRIEQRSLSGGFTDNSSSVGEVINAAYAPNGIWPPGVDTKNITSSTTPLNIHPVFIPVSISQENSGIPVGYNLMQNFPNPFNPNTKIKFDIPKSSFVNLTVYDMLGKEVGILVNENLSAGIYSVELNASHLPSGVYFYKLIAGNYKATKKMILIK
ncbi:MAG: T9SS C-terminal target domain-containing protein [Ignavibacteriae bacterium]|nr:MAG: T9SS C-terminal target domain-containing protein [Ignavibacteriota bacterium]